jgi:hypothetical protein
MCDYSWVEFFHFGVETTVDVNGAEHLAVA